MRILIVDDEMNLRKSSAEYLTLEGFQVIEASNGLAARQVLQETKFDAAIIDIRMPGMSGLELLEWISEQGPCLPVVIISAYGDIEDVVKAMKLGASDYLTKPFDPQELTIRTKKAVEDYRLKRLISITRDNPVNFSTKNAKMQEIVKLIKKSAPTNSTILITGESGTGKEVLAKKIHADSNRKKGPFIPINLGGLPENLIESELFGYEKGAFTGADKKKAGLFETAAGGTLFLDEIGELPLQLQVKLLRVLQERTIQHLGGIGIIPIDVRIIAATNRNLENMIKHNEFREDLYYRLNVIRIEIPPLRKRMEDLELIISDLLKNITSRVGKTVEGISANSFTLLKKYTFPGNIRELENLLERAVILAEEKILTEKDFPVLKMGQSKLSENNILTGTLEEIEKQIIIKTYYKNNGRMEKTAGELGISRRTLLNKIKKYEINEEKT